jgi:hypothetical protein
MKKIEEMEAAAPKAPELEASTSTEEIPLSIESPVADAEETTTGVSSEEPVAETQEVLPIAESGEVKMMPPSTGLPVAREAAHNSDAPTECAGRAAGFDSGGGERREERRSGDGAWKLIW